MEKYKFLEHTADVKFQAFGQSVEEAFTNAAYALAETMTKGVKIQEKIKWKIDAGGKDDEALLYNFLEEFLFLLDAQHFVLSRIEKIEIDEDELEAEVIGDLASNYKFTNDVKAITYNQMFVKQGKDETGKLRWVVQAVVDV
jgi:SHS2 domain-containing protein